jgi:NodT family efflux transporter outer membrane factor (OMF) lipoprotein
VATNYVQVRTLQSRIEAALSNVETQRGALGLTIDRNRAGLVPDLDVRQAELNLATTEAFVPALRSALAASINRLAVLLGQYPSDLRDELVAPAAIPQPPEEVLVSLPADLLRQRPDVRAAERQLAAQTAQIGVATAELYPRFSLSGAFALQAFSSSDFLKWESRAFSFGPSVRWNIFDAGRLRRRVDAQDARAEQAWIAWEQTVLTALEESENAMTGFVREQSRRNSLLSAATQSRRAVELARAQYEQGLTDFQAVLDSERGLALLEDELASSDAAITTNLIALYKALGGGFEHEPIRSAVEVAHKG